jgi:hypothetical protein
MSHHRPLYLAGPMSGYPDFNRPAFAASAERLRSHGFFVLNPGTLNPDCSYRQALSVDLTWIISHAEVCAFQEGWKASPGATAEHALAEALLRDKAKPMTIWYLPAGFAHGDAGDVLVRTLQEEHVLHFPAVPPSSPRVYRPDADILAEWG